MFLHFSGVAWRIPRCFCRKPPVLANPTSTPFMKAPWAGGPRSRAVVDATDVRVIHST
jgi:hypothetical protein